MMEKTLMCGGRWRTWRFQVTGDLLNVILILLIVFPDVGVSCPRPCTCHTPAEVQCPFRALTFIPSRVPKLVQRMNLGFNSISRINNESFSEMRRLELLMMHGNNIHHLPEGVFKDLTSLQVLKLSYNKLSTLTGAALHGLTRLVRLYLDHNQVHFISPDTFRGMTFLRLIHLEGNHLQQLHPATFSTFSLLQHFPSSTIRHLYLSHNHLCSIHQDLLRTMPHLENLHLYGNPWTCDCSMSWIREWTTHNPGVMKCKDRGSAEDPICPACFSPQSLRGTWLAGLLEFPCTAPTIINSQDRIVSPEDHGSELFTRLYFRPPLGTVMLDLSDQHSNRVNLRCHILDPRESSTVQLNYTDNLQIIANMTLSFNLECPVDRERYGSLWRVLAYYSEVPVYLNRENSKDPGSSYQYRQEKDKEGHVYTGVKANIRSTCSWMMQSFLHLKFNRADSTSSVVKLLINTQISSAPDNNPPGRRAWVMIKQDNATRTTFTSVVGRSLQMSCRILGFGEPDIQWMLPDGSKVKAPFRSPGDHLIVFSNGTLQLNSVRHSGSGVYYCIAVVPGDVDTRAFRLSTVESSAPLTGEPVGITVTKYSNEPVHLSCGTRAAPDPDVNWIFPNDTVINTSVNSSRAFVSSDGTLVFLQSRPDDSGFYRCVAINLHGTGTMTAALTVMEPQGGRDPIRRHPQSAKRVYTKVTAFREDMAESSGDSATRDTKIGMIYQRKEPLLILASSQIRKSPRRFQGHRKKFLKRKKTPGRTTGSDRSEVDAQKGIVLLAKIRDQTSFKTTTANLNPSLKHTEPPVYSEGSSSDEDAKDEMGQISTHKTSPQTGNVHSLQRVLYPPPSTDSRTEPQQSPARSTSAANYTTVMRKILQGSHVNTVTTGTSHAEGGEHRQSKNNTVLSQASRCLKIMNKPGVSGSEINPENHSDSTQVSSTATKQTGQLTQIPSNLLRPLWNSRRNSQFGRRQGINRLRLGPGLLRNNPKLTKASKANFTTASITSRFPLLCVREDQRDIKPWVNQINHRNQKRPVSMFSFNKTLAMTTTKGLQNAPALSVSTNKGLFRAESTMSTSVTPQPAQKRSPSLTSTPAGSSQSHSELVTFTDKTVTFENDVEPVPVQPDQVPDFKTVEKYDGSLLKQGFTNTELLGTFKNGEPISHKDLQRTEEPFKPELLNLSDVHSLIFPSTSPANSPNTAHIPTTTVTTVTPNLVPSTSVLYHSIKTAKNSENPAHHLPPSNTQQTTDRLSVTATQPTSTSVLVHLDTSAQNSTKALELLYSSSTTSASLNRVPEHTGPRIIRTNQSMIFVSAGSDVHLQCRSAGEPKPDLRWSRASTDKSLSVINTEKLEVQADGTLIIQNVQLQNHGLYVCTAQNPYGTDNINVTVVLVRSPRILVPPQRRVTVYLRDSVSLECPSDGLPVPQTSWVLPNQTLLRAPFAIKGRLMLLANGTLHIKHANYSDSGIYKCIVSNVVGTDTSSIQLQVTALLPVITEPQVENLTVSVGQNVYLHCSAIGNPTPSTHWTTFSGIHIHPSQVFAGNLFVFPNGSLYIQNPQVYHSGPYHCVAMNRVGVAKRLVNMSVKPSIKNVEISGSPPQNSISYGGVLYLHCSATGNPEPSIIWRTPAKKLIDTHYSLDQRMKVLNNGTLVVNGVTEKDGGQYLCLARNKLGDDVLLLNVDVLMKAARIEPKQRSDQKVLYGTQLMVDCIVSGLPKPEIKWRLPDGSVMSNDMWDRRLVVFNNGTLYFKHVGIKEEGSYTCYAENQFGKDEMTVHIKVVPTVPRIHNDTYEVVIVSHGDEVLLTCSANGEPTPTLSWLSPSKKLIVTSDMYLVTTNGTLLIKRIHQSDEGNHTCTAKNPAGTDSKVFQLKVLAYAPIINGLQRSVSAVDRRVEENQKMFEHCNAEGHPHPQVMWVLAGNVELLAPYFSTRVRVHPNGTLEIKNLLKTDSGQLLCIARNNAGESRLQVHLEVLVKPKLKSSTTEFMEVPHGAAVVLNCPAESSSEITWFLPNGTVLSQDTIFQGFHHLYNGSLMIRDPEAGRYQCTAGDVEHFLVLESRQKPIISSKYSSIISIISGENLQLNCLSSGFPPPELTWTLPSGKVLTQPHRTARFSVYDNGTLLVQKATVYDRGTYICKSINQFGSVSMSVAVIVMAYQPRITNGPSPVTYAKSGLSIQLQCRTIGIPAPEVLWELPDRTQLRVGPYPRVYGNRFLHPHGSLVIQNPSSTDTGFYQCITKNVVGSDSRRTYVQVF